MDAYDPVKASGLRVPLYTPNPWRPGSSLGHLDDNTFSGSNQKLMNPATFPGPGFPVISPIELGILTDIGYTVNSGPAAPPTPVLLFVGLVTIRLRRRKD